MPCRKWLLFLTFLPTYLAFTALRECYLYCYLGRAQPATPACLPVYSSGCLGTHRRHLSGGV